MATTTARHRNERLMPHPPAPPENGLGAWSIHGQSGAVARTDRLAFGLLSDDSLGRGTVGGCGVLLALMVMRAVPCPELRERLPRRADPVGGVAYGSPGDDRPSRPRAVPSRREGPPESRVRCDTTARAGRRVYRVWPLLGSSWCSPQGTDVGSQVERRSSIRSYQKMADFTRVSSSGCLGSVLAVSVTCASAATCPWAPHPVPWMPPGRGW